MENLAFKEDKKYTYKDIEEIDDNNRYEIYDGELMI